MHFLQNLWKFYKYISDAVTKKQFPFFFKLILRFALDLVLFCNILFDFFISRLVEYIKTII